MPKVLLGVVVLCPVLLISASVEAQTQKRNFNLNCGLIGDFARHPQHYQHCKWQQSCTDPSICPPPIDSQKSTEKDVQQAVGAGEQSDQNADTSLSLSVQGRANISAGELNASANASGGASAGSDGGAQAGGGASAGSDGGAQAGGGGSIGVGGL